MKTIDSDGQGGKIQKFGFQNGTTIGYVGRYSEPIPETKYHIVNGKSVPIEQEINFAQKYMKQKARGVDGVKMIPMIVTLDENLTVLSTVRFRPAQSVPIIFGITS
jgi:hypothetical protein